MAFSSSSGGPTAQSSTANQASTTLGGIESGFPVGKFIVVVVAVDNNQTTDGDEGAVSSITDPRGNVWTKGAEFCNGQGSAQAGATCSVWYGRIQVAYQAGDSITVNFTNSASRDKSAISSHVFNYDTSGTIAVEGTPGTLANDGADPGSLNVTTANIACLRVRAIAAESNAITGLTVTAGGWAAFNGTETSGGGGAANMAVRAEYKISTGTGDASNPTLFSADCASVYVAFKEVPGRVPHSPFSYQPFLVQ